MRPPLHPVAGKTKNETLLREMRRFTDSNRVRQRVLVCFLDLPAGAYPRLPGSTLGRSFYEQGQTL